MAFRWREPRPGVWVGVDGSQWFRVEVRGHSLEIDSNEDPANFTRLLQLDRDAEQIEAEIVRRGPELASRADLCRGIRVLQPQDPVETLFAFICSANNNIKRISPMVEKLANYGPVLGTIEGISLHKFPEPEVLAEIPEAELRALGFGYRGAFIPKAARMVAERGGRGYLEELKLIGYESAVSELMRLPGVGRKVADCIALFGLHYGESVPLDTHTWAQLTSLYQPDWKEKAVTEQRYRTLSGNFRDRFGDLSGWAQQVLFAANRLPS